jgi:hypothetical protein
MAATLCLEKKHSTTSQSMIKLAYILPTENSGLLHLPCARSRRHSLAAYGLVPSNTMLYQVAVGITFISLADAILGRNIRRGRSPCDGRKVGFKLYYFTAMNVPLFSSIEEVCSLIYIE